MAKYSTPGKAEVWWVDTIALPAAPTATELNAGTTLTDDTPGMPTLPRNANTVDVAVLASKYEARQVGTRGGDLLSLRLLRDDATEAALAAVAEDNTGFLIIARKGLAAAGTFAIGDEVDVYSADVASNADGTPGRNEADFIEIQMVATADPTRGFAIAA
jgi:hypothetical protein